MATWTAESGWQGSLRPYGPLELLPSAQVLNYGQSIFEGMKVRVARQRVIGIPNSKLVLYPFVLWGTAILSGGLSESCATPQLWEFELPGCLAGTGRSECHLPQPMKPMIHGQGRRLQCFGNAVRPLTGWDGV